MQTICLIALLLISSCATLKAPSEQFTVKEIYPDTFVVSDKAYHYSNVLVARMDKDNVLVASSPFETQGADALIVWIKQKFSPRKIIAINHSFSC
jgi:hypothetical protein